MCSCPSNDLPKHQRTTDETRMRRAGLHSRMSGACCIWHPGNPAGALRLQLCGKPQIVCVILSIAEGRWRSLQAGAPSSRNGVMGQNLHSFNKRVCGWRLPDQHVSMASQSRSHGFANTIAERIRNMIVPGFADEGHDHIAIMFPITMRSRQECGVDSLSCQLETRR